MSAFSKWRIFHLGTHYETHASYLKRYADRQLTVTPRLKAIAAHGGRGFVATAILDFTVGEDGAVLVQVLWEQGDKTWEPLSRIRADAPLLVNTFRRTLSGDRLTAFESL
jgi:hypothetical protein